MNKFETELELAGETRPALVSFDEVRGDIYLERVEIALDVNETYTSLGIYSPRVDRRWLDITSVLSDRQALELTREIKEAMKARPPKSTTTGGCRTGKSGGGTPRPHNEKPLGIASTERPWRAKT